MIQESLEQNVPERNLFDEYHALLSAAHTDDEKRKILARMERAAITVEQLEKVRDYILPDTSMAGIIDRRIKALKSQGNGVQDAA